MLTGQRHVFRISQYNFACLLNQLNLARMLKNSPEPPGVPSFLKSRRLRILPIQRKKKRYFSTRRNLGCLLGFKGRNPARAIKLLNYIYRKYYDISVKMHGCDYVDLKI